MLGFLSMHACILVSEVKAHSWNGNTCSGKTLDIVKEQNDGSVRLEHSVALGNLSIETWAGGEVMQSTAARAEAYLLGGEPGERERRPGELLRGRAPWSLERI
jgi:hypothetical protein